MKDLGDWEIVRCLVDLDRLSASSRELLESVYLLGAMAALDELDDGPAQPGTGQRPSPGGGVPADP